MEIMEDETVKELEGDTISSAVTVAVDPQGVAAVVPPEVGVGVQNQNEGNFLFNLPLEVRMAIIKYLTNDERLIMRLISQQMKEEIDTHIDFHLRIDQSYRGFRRPASTLRVTTCTIVKLTVKGLPPTGIFGSPERVKKLIFDGSVSTPNLKMILKQCDQVEQLVFTHETLGIKNLMKGLTPLENLSHLTHINLQLLRYPLPDPNYSRVDNINAFLHRTFPNLISFKMYFSVWGQWLDLLQFLERHATTLTELELQVGDRCDSRNTEFYLRKNPKAVTDLLTQLDMKKLKGMKLKEFQFRDDVLSLNPTVRDIFIEILKEQRHLEILQFHSPGDFTIQHLGFILRRNQATLEEVVVYSLKNDRVVQEQADDDEEPPPPPPPMVTLDMAMFAPCKNLRTIALSCTTHNRRENVLPLKMIHMQTLPNTLERFHTIGFTFSGDDLVNLTNNSANLKELLIMDAGNMKYSTVIGNILRNCEDLEYVSIRPVVARASSAEDWRAEVRALSKLYSRFMGLTYDPIDDMDGFEADLNQVDRDWIKENIQINMGIPTFNITLPPAVPPPNPVDDI